MTRDIIVNTRLFTVNARLLIAFGTAFYAIMNYRDFSVKSKLIISLFQTVKLSLSISLFQKSEFREIVSFSC